jgi:hypothetical protein
MEENRIPDLACGSSGMTVKKRGTSGPIPSFLRGMTIIGFAGYQMG